ncbi:MULTISPECIES: hypothetical protein [unclassified Microcoleus]
MLVAAQLQCQRYGVIAWLSGSRPFLPQAMMGIYLVNRSQQLIPTAF